MEAIADKLKIEFLRHGVRTARQLARVLGRSQPTISRALTQLNANVVKIGRGSSAAYGLAAPINEAGSSWPLYSINESGEPTEVGRLHSLAGRAWFLDQRTESTWETLTGDDFKQGVFPDLPWFLEDARPQGFLGRAFAQKYGPSFGASRDPNRWTSAEVAEFFLRHGCDLPGSFVLGASALREALSRDSESARPASRPYLNYPGRAERALNGEVIGSSAGGEQPKFTCSVQESERTVNLIVKFTGRVDEPEHQRWADLLAAESIANEVLHTNSIPSARSSIVDDSGRRFLEVERFDRVGSHGRRAITSLRSLDAAFFGEPHTSWARAADRLAELGWLETRDTSSLKTLSHFGELIANNDMHYGNISLFLNEKRPLALAPVYDMLPMAYRPGLEGRLPPKTSQPVSPEAAADSTARRMAGEFWGRTSKSRLISEGFRSIAQSHHDELHRDMYSKAARPLTAHLGNQKGPEL